MKRWMTAALLAALLAVPMMVLAWGSGMGMGSGTEMGPGMMGMGPGMMGPDMMGMGPEMMGMGPEMMEMAQGTGMGAGMGPGPGTGMAPGASGGLNLTAEQKQKIAALQENFFKQTIPLSNELTARRLELRTLWAAENPDQEKILAKQKEANALRGQLQEAATRHRLEMGKVFTPEQQARLRTSSGYGNRFCRPMQGMRGMGMRMGSRFGAW